MSQIHCINISHPEVKKLSEELKLPKAAVASKIAIWQTATGNMDSFPDTEDIALDNVEKPPLANKLFVFLSKLGVDVHKGNVKNLTGYDALSTTDLLFKKVFLAPNATDKELAKETAYVAYQLLGRKNKIVTDLKRSIESIDNYTEIFNKYKERSPKLGDFKIKELIIIDFIADAIKNNYEVPKDSYINRQSEFWGIKGNSKLERQIKYWLLQIKAFINKLLEDFKIHSSRLSKEELNKLVDDLANDILTSNLHKYQTLLSPEQQQVFYDTTIAQDPKAKSIVDRFQKLNVLLTGSLALRKQGDMFRTPEENLHDLDFTVQQTEIGEDSLKALERIGDAFFYGVAKDKIVGKELLKGEFFAKVYKEFPELKIHNIFKGVDKSKQGYTIQGFIGDYVIDIFITHKDESDLEGSEKGFQKWEAIFAAKLKMGRAKDLLDFVHWKPFNITTDKFSQIPGFRHFTFPQDVIKEQSSLRPDTLTADEIRPNQSEVNYQLRVISSLDSKKGRETLAKGLKNNWPFWKIGEALGIPKQQIQILEDTYKNILNKGRVGIPTNDELVDELITDILANNSYTVEINTAKHLKLGKTHTNGSEGAEYKLVNDEYRIYSPEGMWLSTFKTEEEAKNDVKERNAEYIKSSYYSNLTVPGGTNYTENEIATPLITPSIKGHAQFSTDNGIGWFRSDVLLADVKSVTDERFFDEENQWFNPETGNWETPSYGEFKHEGGKVTKTRRILEIQSDLFQKGRDALELIGDENAIIDELEKMGKLDSTNSEDIEQARKNLSTSKQNQFLQLLNKDSNWVTFFIKSIIQDSAKKGYEKVLFPSGNTASKVEGHTTLEEFKKQKEDRLKQLEKRKKKLLITANMWKVTEAGNNDTKVWFDTEQEAKDYIKREEAKDSSRLFHSPLFSGSDYTRDAKELKATNEEINQLKQELERVEKEGFGALKPIFNFYENQVTNILNKTYGKNNVKVITDEYGNTWNEVEIKPEHFEHISLRPDELPEHGVPERFDRNSFSHITDQYIIPGLGLDKTNDLIGFIAASVGMNIESFTPENVKEELDIIKEEFEDEVDNLKYGKDMQIALKYWIELSAMAIEELKEYSPKFEDINDEVKTNYMGERAIQTDGKQAIEKELREFFRFIPSGQKTFINTPAYLSFDMVYNTLSATLAGRHALYADMKAELLTIQEFKPWMPHVIAALDNASEKIRNQFVGAMSKHYVDMQTIKFWTNAIEQMGMDQKMYTLKNKEGQTLSEGVLRVISTNRGAVEQVILKEWQARQKIVPGFLEVNPETGKTIISEETRNRLLTEYVNILDAPNQAAQDRMLIHWLAQMGIQMSPKSLEVLRTRSNSLYKMGYNALFTKNGGVFNIIAQILDSKITNESEDSFFFNNPLDDQAVKKLTKVEAEVTDRWFSQSHKDGENNTIFSYTQNKMIFDQLRDMLYKDSDVLAKRLSNPFNSTSEWGQNILKGNKLATVINVRYLDTLKGDSANRDGIKLKNQSSKEMELTTIGLFQKNASSMDIDGLRTVGFITPTMSDKVTAIIVDAIAHNTAVMFDKETGEVDDLGNATLNSLYRIFLADFKRITAMNLKSEDDKARRIDGYEDGAMLFYFFPEFNNNSIVCDPTTITNDRGEVITTYENKKLKKILSAADITAIKGVIVNRVKTLAKALKQEWIDYEIVKEDDKRGYIFTYLDKSYMDKIAGPKTNSKYNSEDELPLIGLKKENTEKLNYAVMDYTVNYMIANANMFQLFMMDPAFSYKKATGDNTAVQNTYTNLGKRLAMNIAPGNDFPETFNDTYEFAVIEDVKSESRNMRQVRDVLRSIGTSDVIINKYQDIQGADGQEYVTVDEELYLLFKEGSISAEERASASVILNNPDADLHSEEGKKALNTILKPRKPVYTAVIDDTDLGISYPIYVKSSSFPLIPAITKGLSIDKLRVAMLNAKDSKGEPSPIARVAFRSAVKLGAPVGLDKKSLSAVNADGTFKDDIDFTGYRMTLSRNGLRNQQEIPYDESKNEINDGTQQRKLLFSGILKVKNFILDGKPLSGEELQTDFNETYVRLFNGQLAKLNKRLKVDKTGRVNDVALSDILKEEMATGEGYSINDKYAAELDDDKQFTFPLALTPSSDKIESMLLSVANNNIRKIKLPGLSYVLGSEEGFRRYENIEDYNKEERQGIITKKGFDIGTGLKPMRYVHKDGTEITGIGRDVFDIDKKTPAQIAEKYKIAPAQVLIPFKFRDAEGNLLDITKFMKDGYIDTDKIPEDLLTLFGFRIPTQGLNSMSMIEVVGFLPQSAGDLIIGTRDWVTQMGSDFDIDKLYTYVYATEFKDGKLSKATDDLSELKNRLLDIHFAVLSNTDPEVQAQIIYPLVTDKLETDANRISKARNERFAEPGALPETIISRTYQKQKFINGTSGKLGTAVKSLLSTFSAACQEKNIYLGVKTPDGVKKVNIIFGKQSKGNVVTHSLNSFSTVVDWNNKLKQTNISMQQSASVDNEKLQILDKINSNEITFPFENILLGVGYDVTIADHMTSQDILFDYVTEIRRIKDSTATEYIANPEEEVKKRLHAKYAAKVGMTIEELHTQLYSEDMPTGMEYPFTTEELFNMIENGQKAKGLPYNFAVMQALVLDKFLEISELGKDMSNVQSAINTDSAGLGKNFFETLYKEEQVDNIKNDKAAYIRNAVQLLGEFVEDTKGAPEKKTVVFEGEELAITTPLVFKPTTIAGIATENTLYTVNKYFSKHFPYRNRAIQLIIKEIEQIKGVASENVTVRAELHKKIWKNMKSAIYSAQASGLSLESIADARLQLFHDIEYGIPREEGDEQFKSLAYRILEFKETDEGKKNPFIRALQPELYVDGHSLSLLTFNNAAADNFSERNYYIGYITLLQSEDPKIRQLAIDLAIYAYLAGGRQEATQFTKFINYELLEQLGFASFLKNIDYANVLGIPEEKLTYYDVPKFVKQFFQHEPSETRTLKATLFDDMYTEITDEVTGKPINIKVGLIISDDGIKAGNYLRKTPEGVVLSPPPFISVYDSAATKKAKKAGNKGPKKYKLYQFIGNNQYLQIDTLGYGQLYSEYDIDRSNQRTLIEANVGEVQELPQVLKRLEPAEPIVKNPGVRHTLAEKYSLKDGLFNKQTLQDIIDNSTDEWFKSLAKLFLDNFDKLPEIKLTLSDELAAKGKFTWSDKEDKLIINMSRNVSAEDLEETVLHELNHAFVNRMIKNPGNPEEKSIVESLGRMHKKLISTINADPVLKAKYDDFLSKWNTKKRDSLRQSDEELLLNYGANDILEFSSLMMTNKAFRDFCKTIPFSGKQSIWDRFVELIHSMLRVLGLKKGNVASGTIANLISLIENQSQLDAVLGNRESGLKPKSSTKQAAIDFTFDNLGQDSTNKSRKNDLENVIDSIYTQELPSTFDKYWLGKNRQTQLENFKSINQSSLKANQKKTINDLIKYLTELQNISNQSTEENSSLRPDFNSIINKLNERLTTVQKNLVTHKTDHKRTLVLSAREARIKEQLHSLKEYPEQIGVVLDAGAEEMNEVVNMIDGYAEFSFQDIVYMDSILHAWENINKILSIEDLTLLEGTDKFTANTEELLNIEKIARAYRVKWTDIAQKAYSNLAHKDSAFAKSDLFQPLVEMGIFRTAMLDPSHNTAELVQYVDKTIKKALVKAEMEHDKRAEAYDKVLDAFKLTTYYKNSGYDILLQKNAEGKYTGNLEDAYVQEYYDIQEKLRQEALDSTTIYARKAAWKKYFQWKSANTITMDVRKLFYDEYQASGGEKEYTPEEIAEYEEYLKEQIGNGLFDKMKAKAKEKLDYFMELRKEAYLMIDDRESDKELADDEKEYWDVENSPFYYSDKVNDGIDYKKSEKEYVNMKGWQHSVEVAKRTNKAGKDLGWYSKQFETIYSDPILKDFYEATVNSLNELYGYLPKSYRKDIHENSLPVIAKTALQAYAKDGMSNAMGVWKDNFVHSITINETTADNRNKSKNDNPERHLSIRYMPSDEKEQKAREAEYKSYDIEKVVKLFSKMALTYKYKAEIEDVVKIGQQLLQDALEQRITASGVPVLGRDGKPWTLSNSLKNVKAQLDYLVDVFYDESKKNQGTITLKDGWLKDILSTSDEKAAKALINKEIAELGAKRDAKKITEEEYDKELFILETELASYDKTVVLSKIADKILWYVQIKGMGWNLFSAFQNVTFGWISNFIHAAGGEDFTDKELIRANGILLNSILKSFSGEMIANKTAKKIARLMYKYHVLHDTNEADYGNEKEITPVKNVLKILSPLELQQRGEYFAQGQAFVAHLIHTKIGDKSLWDLYDEDGNLPEDTAWTEDQTIDMKLHIDQMLKLIHGNYDPKSKTIIKSGILGRALTQFRSWIAEGAINRFGDKKFDKLLKRDRKGRYRTYGTYMSEKGFLLTIGTSIVGMLNKSIYDKSGLDAVDIANMKKNSRELLFYISMVGLGIVLSMIKGGDADKDKLKYATFLLNTTIRMQQDINFFYNPKSAQSILKNFVPASQLMVDIYNWNDAAIKFIQGDDEIKTGVYAHESRFLRRTAQLLPLGTQIYRQRDAFEQIARH